MLSQRSRRCTQNEAAQDIILTPVITERSVDDMAESKYTFKVAKDANKVEIAKAAEELFQVQVLKVNTVNCTGHTKRMGRSVGKRPDFKKAVITINPGADRRQGRQEAQGYHRILRRYVLSYR